MKPSIRLLLPLAAALMAMACRRPAAAVDGGVRAEPAPAPAALVLPAAGDTLIAGCGGGFSGGGGGLAVTASGEILSWGHNTYAEPVRYTLVRVDTAAARSIFAELARAHFRTLPPGQPANMTCSLELRGTAGSHSVSWPFGDKPPAAVRGTWDRVRALDPGALNVGEASAPGQSLHLAAVHLRSPSQGAQRPGNGARGARSAAAPPAQSTGNPLAGRWRQAGWSLCHPAQRLTPGDMDPPVQDLELNADGTFSVAWDNAEVPPPPNGSGSFQWIWVVAYRGHYRADARTRSLALRPDGGAGVPRDFHGSGRFSVAGDQLTLTGIWFGTRKAAHKPDICALTFTRF